ncbi:MAG TPA: DUF58 domain-containing protein [Chloroflexota bacterium]|nr:DUF58 domain-containing protein [Chloroflexota bacterium]
MTQTSGPPTNGRRFSWPAIRWPRWPQRRQATRPARGPAAGPAPDEGQRRQAGPAEPASTTVVRQFFDEGFTRRLERLQLVSQRMHGAASHGGRRSKKRGTSVEFADYREYTPGDDPRQIDWNVYGRSERLFVKLREDEESLTAHLLVDCSKSMDWGHHHKLTYAKRLAAALGYVALASQDRVEAAGFNEKLAAHLPPLRGKGQTGRLFSFLAGLEPGGRTNLGVTLRSYASMHRRSGLAILISDLLNPGGLEGLTALLDRGFEAVLIHTLDPVETDPELEGDVELYDRESGQTLRVSLDPGTVDAYRRRLTDWVAEIETFCAKRMVRYLTVSTAVPLDELVFRQLRSRRIVT